MSNGVTLYNFIRTQTGVLSSVDMDKPGTNLVFIVGLASGSATWTTIPPEDDIGQALKVPNPKWSAIPTAMAAVQLLLLPKQPRKICRGKMMLDLGPKVSAIWTGSFLDSWSRFVRLNPQVFYFFIDLFLMIFLVRGSVFVHFRICCSLR